MAGGIGASGAASSNFMRSEMANQRSEVKEMSQALNSVMDALKNLTEELSGRVKLGSLPQEGNSATGQTGAAGDKQPVGTGTYIPKGEEDASSNLLATAMAGLSEAEQQELRENQKLSEFEKKMMLLAGLETAMQDVQLDDPEEQKVLEEFLKNMGDIRKKNKRLKLLDDKEKEYEEILRRQEENQENESENGDDMGVAAVDSSAGAPPNAVSDSQTPPTPQPLDPITLAKRQALLGNLPQDLGGPTGG